MLKTILLLVVATLLCPALCSAETINSVTFSGSSADPTITIAGIGFAPEPLGSDVVPTTAGGTGDDFGDNLYLSDSSFNPVPFNAGMDGNVIGLVILSYTDNLISFQLGSIYADNTPFTFDLAQGDDYTVGVNGTTFSGTVDYNPSPTPEPASILLMLTGLLGSGGTAIRRARHA